MSFVHANGMVSGHTARTTQCAYSVHFKGKEHTFNSMDEALAFQRRHHIRPSIPAGDYRNTDGNNNPHKVRTITMPMPGENLCYSYDKTQQNMNRMFEYGKSCYYYR